MEFDKTLVIHYKDGGIRRTQLSEDFDITALPGLIHDLTEGRSTLDWYEYEDSNEVKLKRRKRRTG